MLALQLLIEAQASTYGVVVSTNSVKRLAEALQKAVDENGDTYSNISVEPSRDNPDTELWIVKRDV